MDGRSPLLRKLVTGVNPGSSSAAASRWNTDSNSNNNHSNNSRMSSNMTSNIKQGSVRERARAYEQKHAASQIRAAKSSNSSSKSSGSSSGVPASHEQPQHLQAQVAYSDDKENGRTPVAASSPVKKVARSYATPLSPAPTANTPSLATPLTPRSAKHVSTPATSTPQTTTTTSSRPTTVPASAFINKRQRANSTPKPAEWMAASPQKKQLGHNKQPSQLLTTGRDDDEDEAVYGHPTPMVLARSTMQDVPKSEQPIVETKVTNIVRTTVASVQLATNTGAPTLVPLPLPGQTSERPYHMQERSQRLPGPAKPVQAVSEQVTAVKQPIHPQAGPSSAKTSPVLLQDAKFVRRSVQMDRTTSAPAHTVGNASHSSIQARPRPRSMTIGQGPPANVEQAFEELISTMNLSSTVARKMLALDLNVKSGMLKSATLSSTSMSGSSFANASAKTRLPIPDFQELSAQSKDVKKRPKMVKKMKSFMSGTGEISTSPEIPDGFTIVASPPTTHSATFSSQSAYVTQQQIDPAITQAAAVQARMLKSKSLRTLDPEKDLRKLRVLLRNEKLEWLQEWSRLGGYEGMMERLHETLTVEWRQEQHDDAVLLELLKCFRALLMSDCGLQCLASYSPSPFRPLIELLYSEKRPGDLSARQCIIELIHGLYEVFPYATRHLPKSAWRKPWSISDGFGALFSDARAEADDDDSPKLPMPDVFSQYGHTSDQKGSSGSSTWESAGFTSDMSFAATTMENTTDFSTAESRNGAHALVRSLIIGPPNEKEEAKVDFIKQTHRKRYFQLWMDEMVGTLSDYFWVFCHSGNKYWRMENIEEDKLEEPTVPGGMTGGVEFEAMSYLAAHMRLVNKLAKTCASREAAQQFHADLFESGYDKVVLTLRKCSQTYYPHIHLELARYIDTCLSSGYPLHDGIRRHLDIVKSLSNNTLDELARQDARKSRPGHQRSRTESHVRYT